VPAAPAPAAPAPAPAPVAPAPAAAFPPTTLFAPAPSLAVAQLQAELDKMFTAPAFDRMLWGIQVQSLTTGEILYQLNPTKLVMPASNMKIVTLAAAAERLGWDYTFETSLVASGPIEHGVLQGDLVVVGSGDPTINGRSGGPTAVFEDWAARLHEAGITAIDGRVVADDRTFEDETLGAGWSWDYLVYGYAAPVTAIQYNENVAEVVIGPGTAVGARAAISLRPEGSGLAVENHVTTAAPGGTPTIELRRMAGSDRIEASGAIPLGAVETTRTVAVDNPARFFAQALRSVIVKSGIRVRDVGVGIRNLETVPDLSVSRTLVSRRSAPLSDIAKVLMKVSQNLYAETLLKTLGVEAGAGTVEAGEKVVQEVLDAWGIEPGSYVLVDGSGLSRYNYVTAEMLVRILRHLYADSRHRGPFIEALPTGGVEGGTLARRFRGTRAAGNVHAKTGSIANVRALSGFVETVDGEPLVFSVIANNFTQPQATIDAATDLAIERLANFTRKKPN
jgi:D-alanyl-D-alanine carboxypeptidase/D-alanyl-D-alanine-endopeptidase (penicillin-binding protein 4)